MPISVQNKAENLKKTLKIKKLAFSIFDRFDVVSKQILFYNLCQKWIRIGYNLHKVEYTDFFGLFEK